MTTVDIAVLFEKAIILNGILANGSVEDKKRARAEMQKIMPQLLEIANYAPADTVTRSFLK